MYKTLPLLLLLAACGDAALSPTTASLANGSCGAAQYETLIGQPIGEGAAFLVNGATYRVLYPDDAATTDLDPDRINVRVDGSGVIQSLDCG